MSYGLAVAADADADFRKLDVWLQEEVFDELELLLADPSVLPPASVEGHTLYAFARTSVGVIHHLGIVIIRNDRSRTLTVLGVNYQQESAQP